MSALIVTGASGFLGRHALAPLVERGFEVHAFAHSVPMQRGPAQVRWHRVDLLDAPSTRAALEAVQASGLLHLAWETAHGDYWTSPSNIDWTAASLRLLSDFRACGGRRVVVAGSSAEYDWSASSPFDERNSPLQQTSLYGRCKNSLRELLEAWAAVVGMSWAWGRIFNIYGSFEKPERLVPRVIRTLCARRGLAFDDGSVLRDFLHVEDAADAFAALYASQVQGPVNIASGEAVAVRHVVDVISERLGCADMVDFGALDRPRGTSPAVVASVSRLRDEVGWAARRSLREGLHQTCDWWRARENASAPTLEPNGAQ